MKVLFATDGSREAVAAASLACQFLPRAGLEADAVCVVPEFLPAMTGWDDRRLRERYLRQMEGETNRILGDVVGALAGAGVRVRPMARAGSPAGALVDLARDYDMVVLGSRGRRDAGDVGIGPVASHVAHHASCSVFVGRGSPAASDPHILAAVDGSTPSLRAMAVLASLIDIDNAEITLMHVMETPWLHLGLEQEWFGYEDSAHEAIDPEARWQRRLRVEAERVVERARDAIGSPHPGIERKIAEGLPANEVLSEAELGGYDLVVMGATGASDLKHQMLGSVTLRIASQAPCPVLIIRPRD
ncbi:MAG: universal stress protein [Bryobacteraceae bacterium]